MGQHQRTHITKQAVRPMARERICRCHKHWLPPASPRKRSATSMCTAQEHPATTPPKGGRFNAFSGNCPPLFSSVKPFIGHTLGASEGIEAVYSVLSAQQGYVYPNLNFACPIEELGLRPVTDISGTSPLAARTLELVRLWWKQLITRLLTFNRSMMQPVYINHIASIHPDGKRIESESGRVLPRGLRTRLQSGHREPHAAPPHEPYR